MDARPVAGCALMRHPVTDCQYTLSALDCSFLMQLLQAMPFKTQFRGEIYWRLVLVGCHLQPAAASNDAVGSHNSLCRGTLPATLFTIAPPFQASQDSQPHLCATPCNGTVTTGVGVAVYGTTNCARQVFKTSG